jgi:hypothetical protein
MTLSTSPVKKKRRFFSMFYTRASEKSDLKVMLLKGPHKIECGTNSSIFWWGLMPGINNRLWRESGVRDDKHRTSFFRTLHHRARRANIFTS